MSPDELRAEPILVPAWPSVLRVGLFVERLGYTERGRHLCVGTKGGTVQLLYASGAQRSDVRLDLRDAAVRDAVVRAMWRKLRPDGPEPLTAPTWRAGDFGRWFVDPFAWERPGGCKCCGQSAYGSVVPALASIPIDSPDRDLLALAACAAAVLGLSSWCSRNATGVDSASPTPSPGPSPAR